MKHPFRLFLLGFLATPLTLLAQIEESRFGDRISEVPTTGNVNQRSQDNRRSQDQNHGFDDDATAGSSRTVYVNIKRIIFFLIFAAAVLIAGSYIYTLISGVRRPVTRRDRRRYRRRKKESRRPSRFDDYRPY